MSGINLGRVVLGGLLAGLVLNVGEFVLNVPILGEQWTAAMESLNRPMAEDPSMLIFWVLYSFVMGIVMMWVYAGMRPRFGAGPKTAVIAGLTVWFIGWFLAFGTTAVQGLFPTGLVVTTLVWGIFEAPIATVAGAWLYKEGGAAAPAQAPPAAAPPAM